MWLAEEACEAPVPTGWASHTDADGELFYYSTSSTEAGGDSAMSTYEHPLDEHYKALYKILAEGMYGNVLQDMKAATAAGSAEAGVPGRGDNLDEIIEEETDEEDFDDGDDIDAASFSTPSKTLEVELSSLHPDDVDEDPVPEDEDEQGEERRAQAGDGSGSRSDAKDRYL
jgi:hypothetical protein